MVYPKISLVTPSYNQGPFLEGAIRSVLGQGYPDLEYFVMDGGSSDDSVETLRRWSGELTGWVSEKDGGQASAIGKGLRRASGQVFGWLNADDRLVPGALDAVAKLWRENPSAAAWVGGCRRVDTAGHELSTVYPRGLPAGNVADWGRSVFFYQPACFFSAEAYQRCGDVDEARRYAMDVDLFIRLQAQGSFVSSEQVLAQAIIHEEAKTQAERMRMHAETIAVQVDNGYWEEAEARLKQVIGQQSRGRRTPAPRVSRRLRSWWARRASSKG